MRNIFLGVCLAPYRIDLYNYLHKNFNCEIFFQFEKMRSQNYNMKLLLDKCIFKPAILRNKNIGSRKIIKGLKQLLEINQPQCVFVPEFSLVTIQVLLYKFLFGYKYKIICICDDSYDMVMGNDFSKFHRIARRIITPMLDNLFLVDSRVCNWYQQHYKKGIWMPIISDENRIRKQYESLLPLSQKIASQYRLNNKKVILFVGRLVELKNVKTLIQAYASIKDRAKLVIIGDGECKEKLEEQSNAMQAEVIFTGRKEGDELMAWYNIADIFVLPSTQEAFGAVTNEALLAGCYSLISEKAGSACIIKPGINGKIFNPYSPTELTYMLEEKISQINKDSNIKLKENLMEWEFTELLNSALTKIN